MAAPTARVTCDKGGKVWARPANGRKPSELPRSNMCLWVGLRGGLVAYASPEGLRAIDLASGEEHLIDAAAENEWSSLAPTPSGDGVIYVRGGSRPGIYVARF